MPIHPNESIDQEKEDEDDGRLSLISSDKIFSLLNTFIKLLTFLPNCCYKLLNSNHFNAVYYSHRLPSNCKNKENCLF